MKRQRVTSKQVAERAGVSQTTVSFVLNRVESSAISEATRLRVLEAARELNYVPDMSARALARGRSSNLAFIPFQPHSQIFIDPYIPNVITGFNSVAKKHGYRILVETLDNVDQAMTISDMLRGGEVAGVLLSSWSWELEEFLTPLLEDGYPIVCLDSSKNPNSRIVSVEIDHLGGVSKAVHHLINLGHQRIGLITYGPFTDTQVERRYAAFAQLLADHGLAWTEKYLRVGAYDPDSGYAAALSLLAESPRPTAIFCMNDMMALGAISAIHEQGYSIPKDIAIIGYDDMRFAPFTVPPLTTVRAPEVLLGRHAGKALIQSLSVKSKRSTPVVLDTELIVRASCGGAHEQIDKPWSKEESHVHGG